MSYEECLTATESGQRLDQYLRSAFPEHSRNYFHYLIEEGLVQLNGRPVKKRELVKEGDSITLTFRRAPLLDLTPQNIPLEILFEDEDMIAINKPIGMVVHPAPGNPDRTLVNALLYHCKSLPENEERPGIVHRLDKETSGVIIAAKTLRAQVKLSELFSERKIEKSYLAVTLGNPGERTISAPIGRHHIKREMMCVKKEGGKEAISVVKTLAFKEGLAFVEVEILTGRTHQIRVHLKSINVPILGDPLYGVQKFNVTRPLLHAHTLAFIHPFTGEKIKLCAPLPADLKKWSEIHFGLNIL